MRRYDVPRLSLREVIELLVPTLYRYRVLFIGASVAHVAFAAVEGLMGSLAVPIFQLASETPGTVSNGNFISRLYAPMIAGGNIAEGLRAVGLALLVVIVLRFGIGYVTDFLSRLLSERVSRDLRLDVMQAYVSQPYSFFLARKQGEITNDIVTEPGFVAQAVLDLSAFIKNGLTLAAYFAVTILIFWQGVAALAVALVPLWAVQRFFGRRIGRLSGVAVGNRRETLAFPTEVVGGIRQIKAFGAERRTFERFRRLTAEESGTSIRTAKLIVLSTHSVQLVLMAALAIGLIFLGTAPNLVSREVVLVSVFPFIAICLRALPLIATMGTLRGQIEGRGASVGVVINAMKPQSEAAADESGGIRKLERGIEFRNVRFAYVPGSPVLCGVSLFVNRGQTVALVGPSGAGKSTIVDLIVRLFQPTDGRILVDGIDLNSLAIGGWLDRIGFVSQDTFIFHGTVRDNIAFGRPGAMLADIEKAASLAHMHDFIAALPDGYDTVVGDRGLTLSGGQRQRLAIARALIRDPEILIFDEATSALDLESERLVQAAIDEVSLDRTVVLVAHRLSTVRNADLIVVLDKGSIQEHGSHEQLMQLRGLYWRLYSGLPATAAREAGKSIGIQTS